VESYEKLSAVLIRDHIGRRLERCLESKRAFWAVID
jgi:hypothetical protein